jgi:predicted DNA-binding WGR domain protein
MHRFRALQLAATLFGERVLIVEWDRIGSPGRVQEQVFPSLDLAQAAKCGAVTASRAYDGQRPSPARLEAPTIQVGQRRRRRLQYP